MLVRRSLTEAEAGQVERSGHHDLRARIVANRAAEVGLLEHGVARAALASLECGADSGRSGTDDEQIELAAVRTASIERGAGDEATLRDRVVDEPDAVDLTRDVQSGHRALERGGRDRNLDRTLGAAEHELDRRDRTAAQAVAMTDARRRADHFRPAVDERDHVALRAGRHARSRADARVGLDPRIERRWCGLDELGRVTPAAARLEHDAEHEQRDRDGRADRDVRHDITALAVKCSPIGRRVAVIAGDLG